MDIRRRKKKSSINVLTWVTTGVSTTYLCSVKRRPERVWVELAGTLFGPDCQKLNGRRGWLLVRWHAVCRVEHKLSASFFCHWCFALDIDTPALEDALLSTETDFYMI